ncbi:MAG TPA: PAAR-like domain-containing protein, partial [Janthinobacterium sp.]|nr:PAAR-like domain-containing protein [Janthinobacterium sp.]
MSREFVTKSSRFFCISLSPDVCKTPRGPGTPAVPYIIKGEFQDATGVSPNIRSNGEALALADSTVIPTVTGDEAGTAGGTTSGTYGKRVQHNEKSASVSFNGQRAIREGDLVWMNDKNTIGKIYMRGGEAPKVPGAPATAEERQFDREFEAAMASGDPARRISPALLALQPGCGSAAIAAAVAATAAQKTAVPAARSVPASDGGGGTSSGKASAKSDKPPSCGPAAAAPGGMAVSSRHPVHFGTGEEVLEQTDFVLDGAWPIAWTRCYRSGAECEDWGLLGARWATAFTASLSVTDKGVVYHDAGGRAIRLPPLASGQSCDSRKEGFVLEHSGDDAFTLTWRGGGVDAFIRAADGWL